MALQQTGFLSGEKSVNPHQKSCRSSGLEPYVKNNFDCVKQPSPRLEALQTSQQAYTCRSQRPPKPHRCRASPLTGSQKNFVAAKRKQRLLLAMGEVTHLPRLSAVDVRIEFPNSHDAQACLHAYFLELADRFDGGFDAKLSNPAELADMTPPGGYFVLARLSGRPVGCGVLKCTGQEYGEIKRMWTAPSARGFGVAQTVLQKLQELAQQIGLAKLRLETNRVLLEAKALYRKNGFVEVPPFNAEPYAHHWFEKHLD